MKKIVLLGDSIRLLGYGTRVPALLGPDYTVWQPEDNCRFTSYTLRMLFDYADSIKGADVIHFNCGLWDACDLFGDGPFTPLDQYVACMVRISRILKSYLAPGGHLIFATTTVPDLTMWGHSHERIHQYNQAVVSALAAEGGILIDDLYTPVKADFANLICEDKIHLNEKGIVLCAGLVADAIRSACRPSETV